MQQPPAFSRGEFHLSLMSALLRRTVAPSTSLKQAESNLEWVLCLESVMTELGSSLREPLARESPQMTERLTELLQGRAPPSLSASPAGPRQRITKTARMALKQLEI